ncbi:MAG: Hsp20 family protein [Myxococcales bacterium]|nr:Hsp20 family protein [Myxococcales bacterium]
MTGIVRRTPERAMARWDPFGVMESLTRWDPFRQIERMFEPIERMVEPYEGRLGFAPRFDVKETKDTYLFKADVPGLKEEDMDISVTGNRLTVNGRREEEERQEGERYYTYERSYGSFSRTFTLPEDCNLEHVDAELKNGVLTVAVAKRPEAQPKKISLKGLKEKVVEKLKA